MDAWRQALEDRDGKEADNADEDPRIDDKEVELHR